MNELKDKDLREALKRKEAHRTKPEVPADFCADIMEEIGARSQEPGVRKDRPVIWRWMAAAASLLLLIGIGTTVWQKETGDRSETNTYDAQHVETSPKVETPQPRSTEKPASRQNPTEKAPTVQPSERSAQVVSTFRTHSESDGNELPVRPARTPSGPVDKNLHYASVQDSAYQDPARVDAFIAKLADYNEVKPVSLDCDNSDSTVVSKAYLFEDSQELDLFARLLQVACWYDSKTPGYLLNFSHQQFFFTLKDVRKGQKYLWMAERIGGGRILLQSTRSTINVVPSPACYQDLRERLTLPGNINQQNI